MRGGGREGRKKVRMEGRKEGRREKDKQTDGYISWTKAHGIRIYAQEQDL